MNTQAANAWLILNDADAVETKMLATMNRVLGDYANLEMFMSRLTTTAAFHDAVLRVGMQNGSIERSVENIIRHTLESAEVMIHDDFRAYGPPRIAIRFQAPNGLSFVIQPKVNRS